MLPRPLTARGAAYLGAACGTVLVAGCYSYRPLTGTLPSSGAVVRVQLTDSGSVAMRDLLGPDVFAVVGRFRGRDERGLTLAVQSTEARTGLPHDWQGEEMTIPAGLVATTQERTLAPVRTALVAAGALAAALGVHDALREPGGSGGAGRTPPTPH
jgi:hypothetical protein